jgi:hypothetical protein
MRLVLDSVPLIQDNEVNWAPGGLLRYYEGISNINGTVDGVAVDGTGTNEQFGLSGGFGAGLSL